MTIVTSSVLIESKTARETQLAQINEERATAVLNKIKSLYFALWKGANTTVTEQVAQFYEVPEGSLRKLLKCHREEFESDGLKTIRGKALSDARYLWSLPSKTSQVTVWTPRAVLRAGMLMRDSEVAKRFGMKRARDLIEWLRSIGKEDVLESGLTATPCQYVPWEKVAELDRLWASRRGTRQFLIGE